MKTIWLLRMLPEGSVSQRDAFGSWSPKDSSQLFEQSPAGDSSCQRTFKGSSKRGAKVGPLV